MNSEWQAFLISQGARTDAAGRAVLDGDASGDCDLFDLSHLGLIAVSGPDADAFLQGQLTNDLRELTEEHSQLSSHCSAKGRMQASFRMIRRAADILLQLPAETAPPLLKRLNLFKLRAQVELTDASHRLACLGLSGSRAGELLSQEQGPVPELDNGVAEHQEITLVRLPGPGPRFQALGPVARVTDLWTRLAARGATPAGRDAWALLDIRAGIPTVYAANAEAFVPQMVNMQLVDGVSFTKGCYTGQEVVARMQYLGKLKRRMYRAELESARAPQPGDELFSGSSASLQGAGRVVDARPVGEGRYELLAVVEIAAADQGDVHLGEDGPTLHFLDLPYGFEDASTRSG
jgi:folate-binding protein YgfZ